MVDQWILKDEELLRKLFDVVTVGTAMANTVTSYCTGD
jgi:hypothetical protein